MDYLTLFLIAIGLCFDTFAVSVTSGLILNRIRFTEAMKIAFVLAFFQGLMPLIGWFLGAGVRQYIEHYDHWLAFGALTALGIKMIIESLKKQEQRHQLNPLDIKVLTGMALATSIDALVIGFSMAFFKVTILIACFIIGAVTFVASMLGILFGKKTGARFGRYMEIVGGLILILIGVKILMEHLWNISVF